MSQVRLVVALVSVLLVGCGKPPKESNLSSKSMIESEKRLMVNAFKAGALAGYYIGRSIECTNNQELFLRVNGLVVEHGMEPMLSTNDFN